MTASRAVLRWASHSGPRAAIAVTSCARSCASTRADARAQTISRAHSSAARSTITPASAVRMPVSSAAGVPSITPVIARVTSHANATMTRVCATPIAAIATKNPRDAVA
jgi:hypothetical protein